MTVHSVKVRRQNRGGGRNVFQGFAENIKQGHKNKAESSCPCHYFALHFIFSVFLRSNFLFLPACFFVFFLVLVLLLFVWRLFLSLFLMFCGHHYMEGENSHKRPSRNHLFTAFSVYFVLFSTPSLAIVSLLVISGTPISGEMKCPRLGPSILESVSSARQTNRSNINVD